MQYLKVKYREYDGKFCLLRMRLKVAVKVALS